MAKTKPGKKDLDSYTIKGTNKIVRRIVSLGTNMIFVLPLVLCLLLLFLCSKRHLIGLHFLQLLLVASGECSLIFGIAFLWLLQLVIVC